MTINVNQDYSQFYIGTEQLKSYGSNSAAKKDTLVKYQFNTTDKDGNKVMDKMSKEETMKVLNDISSQYGENVIVQFSGDGLAALADSKKFMSGRKMTEEEVAAKKQKTLLFRVKLSTMIRLQIISRHILECMAQTKRLQQQLKIAVKRNRHLYMI